MLAFEEGEKSGQGTVVQRVVIVGEDGIYVRAFEKVPENLQRVTRDANESSFAFLLEFPQRGDGFIHHLIQIAVFVIVRLNDVHIFDA